MTKITNPSSTGAAQTGPQITYKKKRVTFSKDDGGWIPDRLSARTYDIKKGRRPTSRQDILAYVRDLIGKFACDVPPAKCNRKHEDLWLLDTDPGKSFGTVVPKFSDIVNVIEAGGTYIHSGEASLGWVSQKKLEPPTAHAFCLSKVSPCSKRLQNVFILRAKGDRGAYVKFYVAPVGQEVLLAISFHENRDQGKK